MPAPKGRYPLRYNQVREHTERLRINRCWMQVRVGHRRLLLRQLTGRTAAVKPSRFMSVIPLGLALPVQDRPLDFFPRLREVCPRD
jgi:hypothetical protein